MGDETTSESLHSFKTSPYRAGAGFRMLYEMIQHAQNALGHSELFKTCDPNAREAWMILEQSKLTAKDMISDFS